jgi:hypothetical protein
MFTLAEEIRYRPEDSSPTFYGSQKAPSPQKAYKECGWKRGKSVVGKSLYIPERNGLMHGFVKRGRVPDPRLQAGGTPATSGLTNTTFSWKSRYGKLSYCFLSFPDARFRGSHNAYYPKGKALRLNALFQKQAYIHLVDSIGRERIRIIIRGPER